MQNINPVLYPSLFMNKTKSYSLHFVWNTFRLANKLKTKKMFSLLIVFLFGISCKDTTVDTQSQAPTAPVSVPPLDLQERADTVTNPLFEAVVDDQAPETIDNILDNTNHSLHSLNKKGDTVLGTAIQLKNLKLALFLLKKMTCEDLSHQNNKGESYVYLSAKQGYVELIQGLAKKCFENSLWWPDYEFSDLDPKTNEGETAIHVALNGAVANALNEEYDRGTLEYSWFPFLHAENNKGEHFVHKAVRDNRLNTIEWAVETYCREGDWERSQNRLKRWPSAVWHEFWNGLQGYTPYVNIDQIFNSQDHQGQTALHVASHLLNTKAIRLIANCRWLDFLKEDKNENIALQRFLLALNPQELNHNQDIKDTFLFMVHQKNYMTTHLTRTVDHQNNKGDSSLHISARLSDPFFYNTLLKSGDSYLKNNENQIPEDIFETTQNKIKLE